MTEAIAFTTFQDFLVLESASPVRHELVAGRIYAMAGGTERHDLTAQALWERLIAGARAQRCRAFVGSRPLKTRSAAAYYPDVLVACGNAADDHYEISPTLVIEVLSPSTETTDRREKAESYARIDSLQTYVLAHPTFRRLEIAERGFGTSWHWHAAGPGDVWLTPYGDVDVDELYDAIEAEATT